MLREYLLQHVNQNGDIEAALDDIQLVSSQLPNARKLWEQPFLPLLLFLQL